jgi:tetrapyrrole methylase family protein/MazG family protein
MDKLSEELEEFRTAVREGSNIEEELGDLLFAAVKAGRFAGVDGETALQKACEKFIRRFRRVEQLAAAPLDKLNVPALEELWARAKEEEA